MRNEDARRRDDAALQRDLLADGCDRELALRDLADTGHDSARPATGAEMLVSAVAIRTRAAKRRAEAAAQRANAAADRVAAARDRQLVAQDRLDADSDRDILAPGVGAEPVVTVAPDHCTTDVADAARMTTGAQSAAISTAVVGRVRKYTGRGPTHARTTITTDMIVVTLRDCLTAGERVLTGDGRGQDVLALRHAVMQIVGVQLTAVVEALTGGRVQAVLSDSLADPDVSVAIFLMHPPRAVTLTQA
ncbi:MAG: hypothetical protein QOJ35_3960 [Solirubrobacteraceae bacterium]|nr:hypothetical protein [Solirubrobacteraceae bacterium]